MPLDVPADVLLTSGQSLTRDALEELLSAAATSPRFERCVFDGEDLGRLTLRGAEFVGCSFIGTQPDRAMLGGTRWQRCHCAGEAFLDRLDPLGLWAPCDRERLQAEVQHCVGLASFAGHSRHVPTAYRSDVHAVFRDPSLGTPGAGSHFVELQVVDAVLAGMRPTKRG
jgi:hypothetical protein